MPKFIDYLQEHIRGEVTDSRAVRRYFTSDGSIFSKTPKVVVYPRDTGDISRVMTFLWQLASKGRYLPLTVRGNGTNHTGSALSDGVILSTTAHMDRLLKINVSKGEVTMQPGLNYRNLQDTLYSFGRYLPCYPNDFNQATIAGAAADNASGERSAKYGDTAKYIKEMRVVLSNGEIIEVKPLSKKDLAKKKHLRTLEGKIYREIDELINSNQELINELRRPVIFNNTGYNLDLVDTKSGKFSLIPLLIGSQGTLAITSELTMTSEKYRPDSRVAIVSAPTREDALSKINQVLELRPSVYEYIDSHTLNFITEASPMFIKSPINISGGGICIIEFDDRSKSTRKSKAAKLAKIYQGSEVHSTEDEYQQDEIWALLQAATSSYWLEYEQTSAAPFVEDASVPRENIYDFVEQALSLCRDFSLQALIWGSMSSGVIHLQPLINLSFSDERHLMVEFMLEYYRLVVSHGGAIAGEYNEGMLRSPFAKLQLGNDGVELMKSVKQIFDPHRLLNPGVKTQSSVAEQFSHISSDLLARKRYDYLPYM